MNKLLILLAGLTLPSLYASPILSPAAPALNMDGVFYSCPGSWWSLRADFRGDYVFDRKLEDAVHSINNYSLYSNEGVLTLNLWERCDIYGFVGATSQNLATEYQNTAFPGTGSFLEAAYTTQKIGGAGLKFILWEWDWSSHCGRSFLTADINYEYVSDANTSEVLYNNTPLNRAAGSFPFVSYRETQASLSWGHRVNNLIPYIAVKWSKAHANLATTDLSEIGVFTITPQTLESRNNWGWALGITLVDIARMTITAEARFVDETAMTINGGFRF